MAQESNYTPSIMITTLNSHITLPIKAQIFKENYTQLCE